MKSLKFFGLSAIALLTAVTSCKPKGAESVATGDAAENWRPRCMSALLRNSLPNALKDLSRRAARCVLAIARRAAG